MKCFSKKRILNKGIFILILFSFLITLNCGKKKDDNTGLMVGTLMLLNAANAVTAGNIDADGANTAVAPSSLSLLTPSSTTSNDILESTSKLTREVNTTTVTTTTSFPATSEIVKDRTRRQIFVEDPLSRNDSFKALDHLMQLTDLAGYRWVIDKGAKSVTFTPPSTEVQKEGDTSGSSNSNKVVWIIRGVSADGKGGTPLKIDMWGTASVNGTERTVQLQLYIVSKKSDTNPWGSFFLKAISLDGTNNIVAKFLAQTKDRTDGKQEIEMVDMSPLPNPIVTPGGTVNARATWIHAIKDPNNNDTTLVKSSTWPVLNGEPVSPITPKYFKLAANKNYVYTKVPDFANSTNLLDPTLKEVILQRANPDSIVYKYGVYFNEGANAGKRFIVKTGMPIEYTTGGTTYKGWANAFGVNYMTPTGPVAVADGAQVTGKDLITGKDLGTFTVKVISGRLSKVTKVSELISNYLNIRVQGPAPVGASVGYYGILYWNGTNFVYEKACSTSTMTAGEESCTTATGNAQYQSYPNMKSYLRLVLRGSGQNGGKELIHEQGSLNINVYVYEDINVLSADLKLKSYQDATLPLTQPPTPTFTFGQTQIDYFVSATDLILRKGTSISGTPVTYDPGVTSGQIFMGMLMDNTSGSLAANTVPMDQNVTYTWQTGVERWSKKTLLLDATNKPVKFDLPVSFLFKDPNTGDLTEVSYNGFGQLFIPWVKVDPATDFIAMKPKFVIPDGTILKAKIPVLVNNAPTLVDVTFVVKHLKKSEKPKIITDTSLVQDLITAFNGIDTNTELDSNPKNLLSSVTAATFSAVPTNVDSAPAAIDGENVQDSNVSNIQ